MPPVPAAPEPTAATLAWSFERLVREPAMHERLERALTGDEGDAHLEAVVHETMRLRPVIEVAFRRLDPPYQIRGYVLPPGTSVATGIWGLQRRDAHPDPDD